MTPTGTTRSRTDPSATVAVARDAGRLDDPAARELIGEAHMLQLVKHELERRVGAGIGSGALSDQAAAIGRLFGGIVATRTTTIAFELAGAAGGAWSDDDGAAADCGIDFLMRQSACIGGGTTEMARNVVSERVLGMPRELSADRDVAFRDVPRSR
jgi:alkylation response protein AidB-like acyl-CoA dehydrogenase